MRKLINLMALVMLVSVNVLTPFSYAQENFSEETLENVGEVAETSEDNAETPEYKGEMSENITDDSGEVQQDLQVDDEQESDSIEYKNDVNTSNISVDSTDITKSELENESENQEGGENEDGLELEKIQEPAVMDVVPTNPKDIILEATATVANQTLKINKYFTNTYTVDRGDGSPVVKLTADTTHTYSIASGYTITLSLTGTATRWTFNYIGKSLVPKDGTTMTGVKLTYMPSLADGFGNNATNPGNYFFAYFNSGGAITSLPTGSFDTSKITTAGSSFFYYFNNNGQLTSLPTGSFDTSKITTVGDFFFSDFNLSGQITSLPDNSFRLSTGLTSVGFGFFSHFNQNGQITSLPTGSFDTSKITTVGDQFFLYFNYNGQITSLPEGSFDTSKITTAGGSFFSRFNYNGQITSLPEGSFDTSNITTVGDSFFRGFNYNGQITSLPEGSFDTSKITTAGGSFFGYFNSNGQLTSLPEGSFDTSNITTVGDSFFSSFNSNGQITSLPEGSFDTSKITTAGGSFFGYFNNNGQLTSLPDSFKLSSVAYNKTNGYQNAFNSPNYTINKKVSDLVSGVTAPSSDRNTFSDNQPGRCGVHPNWLVNPGNACKIIYDANGGTGTITGGYMSNVTGVIVGSGIKLPSMEGYALSGWLDASGNKVDKIIFPDMDGQTLYAQWEECNSGYVVNSTGTSCVLKEYTITYDLGGGYLEDGSGNQYEGNQAITYTYSSTENKYVASLGRESVKKQDSIFLGWYTASDGGEKVDDITSVNIAGETLYAHWNDCESGYTLNNLRTLCVLKEYTITYNLGGGYLEDGSGNQYEGNQIVTYTYNSGSNTYIANFKRDTVKRENGNFKGWYTADGDIFDFGIIPPDNGIAYAKYECDFGYIENESGTACEKIRVDFDANGGKFSDNNDIYSIIKSKQVLGEKTGVLHTANLDDNDNYTNEFNGQSINGYSTNLYPYTSGGITTYPISSPSIVYFEEENVEKLDVSIKYGGSPYCTPGYIIVWTGDHRQFDANYNPGNTGLAVLYIADFPSFGENREKSVEIEGDSFTIYQNSGCPSYGFFANISRTEIVDLIYEDNAFENIPEPTREGHKFVGWYLSDDTEFNTGNVSTGEITKVYAKRECADGYENKGGECVKKSSGSSGGGGGGSSKDDTPKDEQKSDETSQQTSQDDKNTENVIQSETEGSEESSNTPIDSLADKSASEGQTYTPEFQEAYEFAKENGITTMPTIQQAKMNGKLTRIAMAKMLSYYAINVLGQKPDETRINKFNDITNKLDAQYDSGVTLAYQLGIMGINMPNNRFRPNDEVTRAEFATALSRMLYSTPDGKPYYITHLLKLKAEGILKNDDYKMKELRGYVMIMLMRSAK